MDKLVNMLNMFNMNPALGMMTKAVGGPGSPLLEIEEDEGEEKSSAKEESELLSIGLFGNEDNDVDGEYYAERDGVEGDEDYAIPDEENQDGSDDVDDCAGDMRAKGYELEDIEEQYANDNAIVDGEAAALDEVVAADEDAELARVKAEEDGKGLVDADAALDTAQTKADAAQAEIEEIKAESDIEGNEAVTEDKLNDLNEELEDLEEEQEKKLREQEELEAEKKRLEAELEAAKLSGDKEKVAQLEGELANVNSRLDSVNSDLNNLNENINNTRESINTTSQQLADQKAAKQAAAQEKLDAAQDRLDSATAEAADAAANQADAADAAGKSQAASDQAQQTAQSLEQQAQSARRDADEKAQAAAQADAEVASAEAALAEAQSATIVDEEGNESPDEAAIASAQAQLDAAKAKAEQAHADADQAEAAASSLEGKVEQAQAQADQGQAQASTDAGNADASNAAADTADNNVNAAQNAVDNAQNQVNQANAAAQNNGGGNNGGGGGNTGAATNGAGNTGGGGGTRAASGGGGASKAGGPSASNEAGSGVKGNTNTTGDSVLDDDLNFEGASPEAVASAIEDYAAAKGYEVPEGFGAELVKVCDKNGIDYGMALAACEANGFGKDGGGLMGFNGTDAAKDGGQAGEVDKDAWKNELSDGVAKLAALRKQGGASENDPVKYQLEAIASKSGDSEWAKSVYGKYSEGISPELAKVDGVKTDYLAYIEDVMNRSNNCKKVLDGKETLYDVIMKQDGCSLDEAKAKVRERLEGVLDRYSGADAACMSGLTMIDIAAEYGVRLNYGAAKTPSHLAKDIDPAVISDCRNFVSWCLDKGHEDYLYSMNVGQLGLGYSENGVHDKHSSDYANMNAGDIMTKGAQHAMMPIYNDPSSQTIILMESSGDSIGVRIRKLSYAKARELGYTFVSGQSIYNGTADSYNYGRSHGY